jgi:hypothetical protein
MHCCPLTRQVLSAALKISIIAALAGGLYFLRGAGARPAGRVELQSGKFTREFRVEAGKYYQFLASAPRLAALGQDSSIELTLTGPGGETLRKPLHAGDPDLYLTLAPTQAGAVQVVAEPKGGSAAAQDLDVQLEAIGAVNGTAQMGSAFHNSWESAEAIELGRPVYATNDDRPYIPKLAPAAETFGQMLAGIHWYKLDYRGPGDRLVHFNVDIQDRDVPAGIEIFTLRDGKPVEYTRGRERYETEKSTNFHGLSKFAPRVISPGVYYIRVMANHPFYKLETDHYPPPPYSDPQLAVRAAMDYIVRRGDAWHANIPRKGAVALRNSNPLQETRLCIACHPTHFSTRGELFAMKAGYPVRARSSLQFLTERLANNPRPLYGKPDASWARMIHAPGNVLSRVAYLTNQYEQLVTGERRTELYRGIAGFLEMYWPQVTQPQMESNGNLPRISGFEVALHSAMLFADLGKRTGEPRYQTLVDQIERVIAGGEVVDNLDLCWKIDALVWLNERAGNNRYRTQIDDLARRLLSYQQADGRWALPFGLEEVQFDFRLQKTVVKKLTQLRGQQGPRVADFQTWHAIYALARAGVTLSDPRLKKAVDVCLTRQTPSGAWQGNPDYKNFDTPFRDTQYALMALTTLYPGPLQKQVTARQRLGWNAGFPAPPSSFAAGNAAATVAALDQHWDRPSPATTRKIRQLLDSPQVLVRYQAAVTLGRFADAEAVPALATRLGDPSKLVQRGAAWALRNIASRRPESRGQALAAIERSLDSTDDRTRWGALRVLNQHFKYVSEEWTLGERVLKIARQDPVAANRMSAAQTLYQWWYWDRDTNHKAAIEQELVAGLGQPQHPWVRRNFIEAYYNTLDDNVRYLYGSWIPRLKLAPDKKAVEEGHHESVRVQAVRYRDAMLNGNSLTRDGLLRALYTHHIREGLPDVSALEKAPLPATVQGHWVSGYKFAALYDPITGGTAGFTSIGNDAEPPIFYADSAPLMNEALLAAFNDPSEAVVLSATRALKGLQKLDLNPALTDRILALVATGPRGARKELAEVAKAQLKGRRVNPERAEAMVRDGDAITLDVVAAVVTKTPAALVATRLQKTKPEDPTFSSLVTLAARSQASKSDPAIVDAILRGLSSKRPQPQQAALRFVLANPEVLSQEAARTAFSAFPEKQGPFAVGGSLSVIGSLDHAANKQPAALVEVRRILLAGLSNSVHTIRAQALTTLRSVEPLHQDQEILGKVAALKKDPEQAVRASAMSFESSQMARRGAEGVKAEEILDYFFFKENVEPILVAKAADGHACASCHANHTLLKLNEPDEYGTITLARSRANYGAAIKMVNVRKPDESLLLNKPIAPMDDAGTGASQTFSHGGGTRWTGQKNSPEYRTILRWIQGARLDSEPAGGN